MSKPRRKSRKKPAPEPVPASAPAPAVEPAPTPVHGDWRVPVEDPAETEHEVNPSFRSRTRDRVDRLMEGPPHLLHRLMVEDNYAEETLHLELPKGWSRWSRVAFALLVLLPLSVVMVYALLLQLYHAAPALGEWGFWFSEPVWFTVTGALVFVGITVTKLLEPLLMYLYVLGHELTHALAVLMSFGRVDAFKFDVHGGYVETESDSLFIALSPYFVPLWMLLWMGILAAVQFFLPFQDYPAWFYSGFGFWWTFHVYWTLWIIPREQPDLLEKGVLLSTLLILLVNIGIMVLILRAFNLISLAGYLKDMLTCANNILEMFRDLGNLAVQLVQGML